MTKKIKNNNNKINIKTKIKNKIKIIKMIVN